MRKLVKYFSSSLIGLLLFTSLVTPTFAEAVKADFIKENGFYVELLEEATLVDRESQEKLVTLSEGIVLKVTHQGEELFTLWNKDIVQLVTSSFEEVEVEEDLTSEIEPVGTLLTTSEVTILNAGEKEEVLATLEKDIKINFHALTEEGYQVYVGTTEGYINSTDVKMVEEASENETEEEVVEESEETTTEEETANVEENDESTETSTEQSADEATEATTKLSTDKNKVLETVEEEESETTEVLATTNFTSSDKYFEASDRLSVYDNSSGKLVHVGYLNKGQVFPRVSDYGSWHKIKYGNGNGFVWKASTIPATQEKINSIKNLNNGESNSGRLIETIDTISVYDNTSGSLVSFAFLFKGITYPIIGDYGSSWVKVDVAGRIGYVYKPATKTTFQPTDKYFEVTESNIPVLENSQSNAKVVGYLTKGQVFPRVDEQNGYHRIKFGNGYAYVSKTNTTPSDASKIKNENKGLKNSSIHIVATSDVSLYDNSTGSLVLMGTMLKETRYPIISQTSSWIKVDVGGRIASIYKPATRQEFQASDEYFQVIQDRVTVYSNSTGALLPVGHLIKGQSYKRVSDYGSGWHRIKYGNGYGYVWKEATTVSTSSAVPNQNQGKPNSDRIIWTEENLTVYDNSTGKLLPFGSIRFGESYPIIRDFSSTWYEVDFAGRLGYVYKPATEEGPAYITTQYDLTLNQMMDIQYGLSTKPQTDKIYYDHYYMREDGLNVVDGVGTVIMQEWNLRSTPDTTNDSNIYGFRIYGEKIPVIGKSVGLDGFVWYKVTTQFVDAHREDAIYYVNPENFDRNSQEFYQFLTLSKPAGSNPQKINEEILNEDEGILKNHGQSFVEAGKKFNINELYLISHSSLETGKGTSELATGMVVSEVDGKPVTPRKVYNMYGIRAKDRCELGRSQDCAAEYAYKQEWFSPEEAIIGGAQFVAEDYVNHPVFKQDTLYKMRWNPASTSTEAGDRHQYATDMAWTTKQVDDLKKMYDKLETNERKIFDIPAYKNSN
ncbi:glucosaminidase domain-containing protein [Sutcliffiella horikoshii]|uniref:Mannosyl-glycoprotein endo-beta-N-acetylglucosamidase-like domain-containing protein n=1 Tax=Sutcliffiella horikoshii TaxID=79883 RepID=A0A5D4T2W8_9BACI|nr:glucosaminidase domain-containing protein [Sutcliffiella horikoshii]TYS70030.1 hypothetical protein FZC75_15440 [Sutcliffiella horikoshii]